jgi:hypothetical protein
MPSLSKHASVPATVTATSYLSNGVPVTVTGAGPWTLTDAQIAALSHVRVNVGGVTHPLSA